jgi:uncharacterized protein YggU (UPF0235/DUF167 family)
VLIKVKTHPQSKKEKIVQKSKDSLEVWLKEKPIMNQANQALIYLLSDFFKIKRSDIKIIRGLKRRNKIFEINL